MTGPVVPTSTPAISLRPLRPTDADVIAGWASDPEFCEVADWPLTLTQSHHRRFQQRLIASPPVDLLRLGVVLDDVLVGYVDLHGTEPHRRELGFLVGPRARWGRGLGHAAATAALDRGFGDLGLGEIWAEALDANVRSVRVLQRLGMTETGRGGDGELSGRASHFRRFTISTDQWTAARGPTGAPVR